MLQSLIAADRKRNRANKEGSLPAQNEVMDDNNNGIYYPSQSGRDDEEWDLRSC